MSANLTKRTRDLEAALWSRAECIEIAVYNEAMDFLHSVYPLNIPILNSWCALDTEALRIGRRMERILKALPPIHPAFLKNMPEATRRAEWGLYQSAGYRKLFEYFWTRFLEHACSRYDLKNGGLLGVALRLYEKDIDRWIAEREYLGVEWSREELVSDMIELWKIIRRECKRSGEPKDKKANDEIWRRAQIESERVLYGREMTEEELEFGWQMWLQLREDMKQGKQASESEAARYLRDLIERYPRKVRVSS